MHYALPNLTPRLPTVSLQLRLESKKNSQCKVNEKRIKEHEYSFNIYCIHLFPHIHNAEKSEPFRRNASWTMTADDARRHLTMLPTIAICLPSKRYPPSNARCPSAAACQLLPPINVHRACAEHPHERYDAISHLFIAIESANVRLDTQPKLRPQVLDMEDKCRLFRAEKEAVHGQNAAPADAICAHEGT
ncbi:hypothetical protein BDZ89DRAFT_1144308 [Hymenopellis radicata]|nr:hypothetical protein BDZ89DRAFT_1144308 [Hymenopellis radicata]